MLLVNKISHQQILNYKKNIIDCLIYNSSNNYITEIHVYLEASVNDLPNIKNVRYIIKRDKTVEELIDYSKKISQTEKIIVANWDIKFSEIELKNYILNNRKNSNKNYEIFSRKEINIENKSEVTKNTSLNTSRNSSLEIKPIRTQKNELLNHKLNVIIISVNYNDFLLLSLKNNVNIFDSIHVVTSTDDFLCHKICEKFGVNCIKTDIMYEGGSKFNKGKAINFALNNLNEPGFVLILDADIIVNDKINLDELEKNTIYGTGRYIINDYNQLLIYQNTNDLSNVLFEQFKGIGFFQLFYNDGQKYPENYDDAGWSDLVFRDQFRNKRELQNIILHLGSCLKNWQGRITDRFIDNETFVELLSNKSTYTICSYYFNYRGDIRQKENFIKFLEQWKGYYDKMIVGIVDYGDIDFEIPCQSIILEGDEQNKIWSKEILINKIVEQVDTDYFIWIDGDLIYENLDWLENIDEVAGKNDFVQLFETINYLDENGEISESHKSILSVNPKPNEIDKLLGELYKPGGSWLGKTSILKEKKLFDKMYVGGGDTIFLYGLFGLKDGWTLQKLGESNKIIQNLSIEWIDKLEKYSFNYLKQNINHLYHGNIRNRSYNIRYKKLKNLNNCSILIPAYKSESFISECINSILKQNNQGSTEIIIGVDACEDTLNYLLSNEIIKTNCKILYFEENSGPYLIRNTLLTVANYENILFFDADDIMCDNLVNNTLKALLDYDSIRWMFKNFYDNFQNGVKNKYHAHGVFGIKKNIIMSMNGFLPWRIGADSEFLERCKVNSIKTFFIDEVCFHRRQHDNNQTRNKLTGLGTPARVEVQKRLKKMKDLNNFTNPDILNVKKFSKL